MLNQNTNKGYKHTNSEGIGNSHPDLLSLVPRTFMPPLIFFYSAPTTVKITSHLI